MPDSMLWELADELDKARPSLTPVGLVLGGVEVHVTFTAVPVRYIAALSIFTETHVPHALILPCLRGHEEQKPGGQLC